MNAFEIVKDFAKRAGILLCEGNKWIASYDLAIVNYPPGIEFSLRNAYIALHEIAHNTTYRDCNPIERDIIRTNRKLAFSKNPSEESLSFTYGDEELAWKIAKAFAEELGIYEESAFSAVQEEGLSSYIKP